MNEDIEINNHMASATPTLKAKPPLTGGCSTTVDEPLYIVSAGVERSSEQGFAGTLPSGTPSHCSPHGKPAYLLLVCLTDRPQGTGAHRLGRKVLHPQDIPSIFQLVPGTQVFG